MTGITQISAESIFSDLNNLEVVTTSSDKYETAFGFTEEEVFEVLEEYGLSDEKEGVKFWYDGFRFGKYGSIYNPWSVLHFLDKRKFAAYWVNTSSNALVSRLIQQGSGEIKSVMEDLLRGETVCTRMEEAIIFDQLTWDETAVWSLLVASGYLKIMKAPEFHGLEEDGMYELAVTNFEIRQMFRKMITAWFQPCAVQYHGFIRAMLSDQVSEMNDSMQDIMQNVFSCFDTGTKSSQPESFYHSFVLGLLVALKDSYLVTSNRESGYGRYDIMLEPLNKNSGNAVIIEFKVHRAEEQSMQKTVNAALQQIAEKKYAAVLMERGIPKERIMAYGFVFKGKKVLIQGGNLAGLSAFSAQM